MNPLLQKFNTKYNSAPFNEIKEEHYLPAFKELIEISKKEVEKIIAELDRRYADFDHDGTDDHLSAKRSGSG